MYNIGLAYIGAVLKEAGHEVEMLDYNTYFYTLPEMIKQIRFKGPYDAIALGTLITAFPHVRDLIFEIKRIFPDTPVWVGNSVASVIPEIFLEQTLADVVVIGEGEQTVVELASGKKWSDINGLAFRNNNGIVVKTALRQAIEDLDSLPLPDYSLFNQEIYMTTNRFHHGKRLMTLGASSRGCPYKCTYCYHAFQGMKPRYHSAERMINEIEKALSNYEFDWYVWGDDLFIANRQRLFQFCDMVERLKIKQKWICTARVNLIDRDLLRRVKSAGCVQMSFGVESGSRKILEHIRKNVTPEQALKALKLCNEEGIHYEFSLMIGNVGETVETVQESVEFAKKADRAPVLFITTPYPGTELYEFGKSKGLIQDDLKLIESYSEQATTLTVNFSNMSDEELLHIKASAENEMRRVFLKRHPMKIITEPMELFVKYLKIYGVSMTFLRIVQKMIRIITRDPTYKLRVINKLREGQLKMYD